MKKKLHPSSSSLASAAAILAGGVLFTGPANAAIVFSEDFEGINAFGMGTYMYSQNYTLPNYLTPGGGLLYGNGGTGITGQVSTNSFPLPAPLSLTAGTGISSAQIDAGLAAYDFRGQFSTYKLQGDFAQLSVTFKNGANVQVGNTITLGGSAFTDGLAIGLGSARAWGQSAMQGAIPAGARTLDVVLTAQKAAEGTAIDGYVDNITLSVAPVPEPTTFALIGCAALGWLRRRRR
jgi:hypothetical protein